MIDSTTRRHSRILCDCSNKTTVQTIKKQEQGKLAAIHENAPVFLFLKDLKIVIPIFLVTLSPLINDIMFVIIRTIHTY